MNNRGLLTTNQRGHFNNYGNVLYHPKDMSKIISLSNINKKNLIIHNSVNGYGFIVTNARPGQHDMIFASSNYRIYYNYMGNTGGLCMINTV